MDEAEIEVIARQALQRAVEDYSRSAPHAPITMGQATVYLGQAVQSLLVLKPCKCGRHRAMPLFMAVTPTLAMREATEFVKALIKPDEDE